MIVTIDFWNTLFDNTNGKARNSERFNALFQRLQGEGAGIAEENLQHAFQGVWSWFDYHWLEHHRTPTSIEMIREITRVAGATLSEGAQHDVADIFERGILRHPPRLLPGVEDALAFLVARARLAIISDTAFSPGRILRQLMEEVGIARYFSAFVFSDETHVAKPHPDAFGHALRALDGRPSEAVHIGDIERTDIVGAKGVGMRAILYRGDTGRLKQEEETIADAVVDHWDAMGVVVEGMLVVS